MKGVRTKRGKRKAPTQVVRNWKAARAWLERWRKQGATLQVELKRPRAIDVVPIDFLRGEPVDSGGTPTQNFRGQLIFFTTADVTFRRPSGAILVIDSYEIAAISDPHRRFEPA